MRAERRVTAHSMGSPVHGHLCLHFGVAFRIRSLFSAPRVWILENKKQFLFVLASLWCSRSMKWPSVVCWMFGAGFIDPCKGHSRWWHRAKGCPCSVPRPRTLVWAHFLCSYLHSFLRNTFLVTVHWQRHPLPPLEQSHRQQKRAEGLSRWSKASKSIKHRTLFSVIQYLFPWKRKWQPGAFCKVVITLVAAHGSRSVPVSCSRSGGQSWFRAGWEIEKGISVGKWMEFPPL